MTQQPMRVFVPSKGRAHAITTHRAFSGPLFDVHVVVHTQAEREAYIEAQRDLAHVKLVVSDTDPAPPGGLTRQREFVCRHLARPGEYFVFADDNIKRVTAVDGLAYDLHHMPDLMHAPDARKLFNATASGQRLLYVLQDTLRQMVRVGAHMAGFAVVDNPAFREKKWRTVGFVCGKMTLWHNVPYEWDHSIFMEDLRATAQHLLVHGKVLVNNYVWPDARHHEPGGCGTYRERLPYLLHDVQALQRQYPGLFRTKKRRSAGWVEGSDLSLRLTTPQQVAAWREQMQAQARRPGETPTGERARQADA